MQTETTTEPVKSHALAIREQIVAAEPMALVPTSFIEAQEFAIALCKSSLVPQALRDNAPNTLMMILAGAEIHIPPIASMRVFHVMDGVPKLSADGIAAICMRDPSCEYLEPAEQSPTRVTWIAKKKGRPEKSLTITREDMIAAGLYDRKNRDGSPGNHQKYPRQMLNARCKAEICRLIWPHLCAGMISAEEIADDLGIDAYAIANAIDVKATEKPATVFAPLPVVATSGDQHRGDAPARRHDKIEEVLAALRDPTPTQGPGSAAGMVGDDAARERFVKGEPEPAPPAAKPEPAKPAPVSADLVKAFGEEMMAAPDVKALAKVAGKIGAANVSDEQRTELLKIFNSCRDALNAKAAKAAGK